MKKLIWTVSLLPLLVTSILIQFLPSKVPIHYDLNGKVDNCSSKYFYIIIPLIIIATTIFWTWLIAKFEKEAAESTDRKRESALANAKVLKAIAILNAVSISLFNYYLLGVMIINKEAGIENLEIDSLKISCLITGILFIFIGNILPKTKRNGAVGLRISWSEYNDVTWRKSNFFAGVALMLAGLFTIITSAFVGSYILVVFMIIYLFIVVIASCVYAHKVYLNETNG